MSLPLAKTRLCCLQFFEYRARGFEFRVLIFYAMGLAPEEEIQPHDLRLYCFRINSLRQQACDSDVGQPQIRKQSAKCPRLPS
jgi:hypothetical protein